jgi:4-amino-4-deoxy-L-arabinose transferase-like glycosyltransferase
VRTQATAGRLQASLLWCVIAVAALVLRLIGLRYGLPAVYNPDEVAIMSRALAFAKGDLNPHNFLYPTFYFYVLFAWEGLTALLAVATRAVASFGAFQREFFLDPTRVFVAGRLLTALLGTLTVLATGILGTRVAGRFVGIGAAVLLAVAPLHVLNSHYVKHDVPVTLLIVLAYLAYERLWTGSNRPPDQPPPRLRRSTGAFRAQAGGESPENRQQGALVTAAAITGVAFSTHYYTIFLAIPLAWAIIRSAHDVRVAITRLAIAALISAVVFFLLSPFLLVDLGTALRDIRANRQIVLDRAVANLGYLSSAARYAKLLLFDTVGFPGAILAVAGVLVGLRREPTRTAWLLAFTIPFLLFIFSTYPASRYLVPVTPFIALFAAIAIESVWKGQGARRLAAHVLLLVAVVAASLESARADIFIRHTDTRTLALDYINTHIPPGTTILTQPYSVPLVPTADVLREAVRRSGREMPKKTELQIAGEPYPTAAFRLIYLGRGLDADKLYLPYEQLGGTDPLRAARAEHVAFVVLKRYNESDPATLPFLTALAREGRRLAVFSPYRDTLAARKAGKRPEPFLHNTDARIDASLERPGPAVEIWQLDGSGS